MGTCAGLDACALQGQGVQNRELRGTGFQGSSVYTQRAWGHAVQVSPSSFTSLQRLWRPRISVCVLSLLYLFRECAAWARSGGGLCLCSAVSERRAWAYHASPLEALPGAPEHGERASKACIMHSTQDRLWLNRWCCCSMPAPQRPVKPALGNC